eukprot:6348636-Pyramimonas_sp.AAC.1
MAKVVLSEQHRILDFDRVATMRVYVTAAAKRAALAKEDDLLARADIQANPVKVPKADLSKSTISTTLRYVYKSKFAKNGKGEMERAIRLRLVLWACMDSKLSVRTRSQGRRGVR